MKKIHTRTCSYFLLGGLTAVASQTMVGQDDEEIFELSPFTVDAAENEGYRATSTLAGTRLRTELKDIGTSVQVITKDFLDDIDAQDAASLLNYTTSTEIGGAQGNYSGNNASEDNFTSQEARGNPQSTTRVRGLFRADLTRDYFKSIIPFDSYNTSSVDINRGSNATLFGLGSPAGIINNTLDAPFYNNKGEFKLRFDSEGSVRGSLNVNRVLVEDKLAVRVALLKDDRQYHQEPTFQDTERGYIAANWKIRPNSVLKANFETGTIVANRPDSSSPLESITPWFLMGKRILDTSLATGIGRDLNAPTGIKVDRDGDGVLDDVYPIDINAGRIYDYMQFGDGSFVNEGNWTWDRDAAIGRQLGGETPISFKDAERSTTGGVGQPQIWGQGVVIFGDGAGGGPTIPGFVGQYSGAVNFPGDALSLQGDGQDPYAQFKGINNISGFYNNYKRQGFTNLQGYDWGKNLLAGTTPEQDSEFDALNLTFEQTFWDNKAGFAVSYYKQTFDNEYFTPLQLNRTAQIRVDMNARLPDGRVNPNVGRPYALARNGRNFRSNELETKRATAFISHDFAENSDNWTKWLGRHTVTGLYDQNSQVAKQWGQEMIFTDPELRRNLNVPVNEYNAFSGRVFPLVYLGPSLLDDKYQTLEDVELTPPTNLNLWNPGGTTELTYWDSGIQPGTDNQRASGGKGKDVIISEGKLVTKELVTSAVTSKGSTRITDTVTDSQAGVWQGYFLENHIVSTIGYRKDTVENSIYSNAPVDEFNRDIQGAPLDQWAINDSEVTEDRWSYGVVAHIPAKWTEKLGAQFSLHYAESSNFSLQPGRVNWADEELANPSGDTTEWGFSATALQNKLSVRVNWFETNVNNLDSNPVNFVWNNVYQRADGYFQAAANTESEVFADFNREVGRLLLSDLTPGENAIHGMVIERDESGNESGVFYTGLKNVRETEDVSSEGMEIEVTYNPTKNWRIHFNLARQETVKTNIHPNTAPLLARSLAAMDKEIPGFGGITLGELSNGAKTNDETWITTRDGLYGEPDESSPTGVKENPTFWTIGDAMNGKHTEYLTKKAAEGSLATEQRKWRFNMITNYSFREGALKGASIGGAYRWQDKAAIGFPFIQDENGNTVGDIANPVYGDAEDSIDLFASYRMPFLKEHGDWDLRLQVRNAFASDDDIIPVQLQGDGVTFSRWRLAPQREVSITSTFKF